MADTVLLNATRSEAADLLKEEPPPPPLGVGGGAGRRVQDSAEGLPPGRYETHTHKVVEVEERPVGRGGSAAEEQQLQERPGGQGGAGKQQVPRLWAPPSRGGRGAGGGAEAGAGQPSQRVAANGVPPG